MYIYIYLYGVYIIYIYKWNGETCRAPILQIHQRKPIHLKSSRRIHVKLSR